jgi:hypothetical protein
MTSGERRLAQRLGSLLEDDYLVWYDIPIGKIRRYPDFIILHPSRGLLFLEVKDWKRDTIQRINKTDVTLLTNKGTAVTAHPLEQARQYAYNVVNLLSNDPMLHQHGESYKGKLIVPYGWGAVFTNITRKQIEKAVPEDKREILLPDHLVIYKDEMTESTDPEKFQEQLWGMFNYHFGEKLSLPQVDRIRAHLFPEILIDSDGQSDLFFEKETETKPLDKTLPDIIKILDIQQEQLAKSLGEGHRVIHGVAGSGKTLILGFRCLYLAHTMSKPILVLCFNITLAAKLRAFISAKGIAGQVQVYHFHDWCGQQLKTFHIKTLKSDKPIWERQVDSVIQAVDKGQIPRAQYGALMIDEGHDFEEAWLRLITQMVDPETDSLLLLYDDAQSIYQKRSGIGFSLKSVGINAQGRTTILKANYRNTREILEFSYHFAQDLLDPRDADDDHIPVVKPMAAGSSGPKPEVRQFSSISEEIHYAGACLQKWHSQGVSWSDMAVLYADHSQGRQLSSALSAASVPHLLMASKAHKAAYQPGAQRVSLLTIHSSKGLEFSRVIMLGIGHLDNGDDNLRNDAPLLYVGMTRAMECLLVTTSRKNLLSQKLIAAARTI